jgi:hypothetical protein
MGIRGIQALYHIEDEVHLMPTKKNEPTEPTGPCPPLEDVTEDERPDTVIAEEAEADYDVEETQA